MKEVTPLTRGIIWLVEDPANTKNPHYKEIDYLLDGLLTANLRADSKSFSRVLVGKNYGQDLFILVTNEINDKEIQNYISLFKDLNAEQYVLVVDELKGFEKVRSLFGKLSSHLRVMT